MKRAIMKSNVSSEEMSKILPRISSYASEEAGQGGTVESQNCFAGEKHPQRYVRA